MPALANISVNDIFIALKKKDWARAHEIAKILDASNGKGDVLRAFSRSVEASNMGDCETAKKLSVIVIRVSSGFLPAYEVLAGCLIQEGNRNAAANLYQDLSNVLPVGAQKELAQKRSDALRPDLSPRLGLDFSIIPSSNTSRRTSNTSTGNGGVLSDESRAQDGITFFGNILFSKPIFNDGHRLTQFTLKTGASYDTVTNITRPVLGGELRNTWNILNKHSIYAAPFYEYTWSGGERFFDEAGIRFGGVYQLDQSKTVLINANASKRNFANDEQDSNFGFVTATLLHVLDEDDKLQYSLNYGQNAADNDFFNIEFYSAGVEWQHLFENGLISSLEGRVGWRNFDRLAPLTIDNREDEFKSATVGLSHRDFAIYGIRPELTYTYTNQSSNDLFSDFEAHDLGVRLRANY